MKRLFVYGFHGLYGGAGTELHHQILAWRHMGVEVHLIPTNAGYPRELGRRLGGLETSAASWQEVFRQIDELPL